MRKVIKRRQSRPSIVGLGLVALDVIVERGVAIPTLHAGGTCANVMMILSHLGWHARPIARLADDLAGQIVVSDLRKWGVDVSLVNVKPAAKTPVIVEKIRADRNGIPFHTFSFFCHGCGARFPGFQPVTAQSVAALVLARERPDVFFVDRVSKSAVALAEAYADAGAVIVFEPQRTDESKSFRTMLDLAHVVKYSHERIDELPASPLSNRLLEIQTIGRGGLRYRLQHIAGRRWCHVQAESVEDLRDAAGSGDWLTAGVINHLWRGSSAGESSIERMAAVEQALNVGQRLAAWNCAFPGARGGMYSSDRREILAIVSEASDSRVRGRRDAEDRTDFVTKQVCTRCSDARVGSHAPRNRLLASHSVAPRAPK